MKLREIKIAFLKDYGQETCSRYYNDHGVSPPWSNPQLPSDILSDHFPDEPKHVLDRAARLIGDSVYWVPMDELGFK